MDKYRSFASDLREYYSKDKRRSKLTNSLLLQSAEFIEELCNEKTLNAHWIVYRNRESSDAVCSFCRSSFYYSNKGQYHIDESDYCPSCGCFMVRKDREIIGD